MQSCLDGSKITGAQSLIQAADTLMAENLLHTVQTVPVAPGSGGCLGSIELQSGLHQPDGVRGRRCRDTSRDSGLCVKKCRVLAQAENFVSDTFAVAVHPEFDCGGRYNTCQTRSKTTEECAPSFGLVDVADNAESLVACFRGERSSGGSGGLRNRLVKVGLKTCS